MKVLRIAFLTVWLAAFAYPQEDPGAKIERLMNSVDPNDPDAGEKLKAMLEKLAEENKAADNPTVIGGYQAESVGDSIQRELERDDGPAELDWDFIHAVPAVFIDLADPDPRYSLDNISGFSNMKLLYIRGNLSPVPIDMAALMERLEGRELTEFFVVNDKDGVTELPDSIGSFSQLRKLGVFGNQIAKLPDSIGDLTSLEELYVDGNPLSALPASVGRLSRLRVLGIAKTRIGAVERARIQKLLPGCKILTQ